MDLGQVHYCPGMVGTLSQVSDALTWTSLKETGSYLVAYILCYACQPGKLPFFPFKVIILGGGSNKILLQFMSKSVLPMPSSWSFVVSGVLYSL